MAVDLDPLSVRLLYSPHGPEVPQLAYLLLDDLNTLEALYGGAAGGGKSDALLMAALRYVDVPRYSALLIRRTYAELEQADGLLSRAHEWLAGSDARFRGTPAPVYTFPSGATLTFGYLDTANAHLRYQGGAYQFIGFDELTQFREFQYRYLLSRVRRPSGASNDDPLATVPLRMRAATNPGGPGHGWVKRRFIEWAPDPVDPDDPDLSPEAFARRIFIPARLEDNPHLDADSYRRSLAGLPRVERRRLELGDWDADTGDKVYDPAGVRAALTLGEDLDADTAAGRLPPGGPSEVGLDPGEHAHGLYGIPLPHGGIYVVAGEEWVGVEPGQWATALLELARHLPGAKPGVDPFRWVNIINYDPGSSGAQTIRTVRAKARARHPGVRFRAVPFGNYKREAIDYLRWLFENSAGVADGDLDRSKVGYIAISPRAATLRQQLPDYIKDPATGDPIKEDDHGPDALVCLIADTARRHRDRGELERQRAHARARRVEQLHRP